MRDDGDSSEQSQPRSVEARVHTLVFLARHGAHALLGVPQKTIVSPVKVGDQDGRSEEMMWGESQSFDFSRAKRSSRFRGRGEGKRNVSEICNFSK